MMQQLFALIVTRNQNADAGKRFRRCAVVGWHLLARQEKVAQAPAIEEEKAKEGKNEE